MIWRKKKKKRKTCEKLQLGIRKTKHIKWFHCAKTLVFSDKKEDRGVKSTSVATHLQPCVHHKGLWGRSFNNSIRISVPFCFEWALIMSGSKKLTPHDTCNISVKSTLLALETCCDDWLIKVFDSNLNPRWLQKTSKYELRSINPFEQIVKNSVSSPQVKGLVPR